jgi:glycosyltransferase involved in cell wall biosynthesis
MARIALLAPNLAPADAVTNDVLGMSQLLTGRGHEVQLFANDWNFPAHQVRHASAITSFLKGPDDVLIYHHSIGWDGFEILNEIDCRTIIKYHNVTPPEFFEGISSRHQQLCNQGRRQMKYLARAGHDLYLADSAYNMNDLIAEGASKTHTFVVPPFNNADGLEASSPDLEIVDKYSDGRINLVMVGGVRPNKGHVLLLEAFATYRFQLNCAARLLIVGAESPAFETYSRMLRELVELLGLEHSVVFTGEVGEPQLKAYYLLSNVFLMASEHEGFCVPLVEAMAIKLPIVAFGAGAIPETAGNAAVIWPDRDPSLMAQSIDYLIQNEAAAVALGVNGRQRYEENFSNQVIGKQFLQAISYARVSL